jgi:hypothetical protein
VAAPASPIRPSWCIAAIALARTASHDGGVRQGSTP